MKKILSLILTALMLVGTMTLFAGCGGSTAGSGKAAVIDIPLTDELYAYAVKKGNTELLEQVNAYLTKIKGDGTFDAIVNKYFGDGTPTPVVSAKEMKTDGSQLIVATNAAFAPFEYMEGENYVGLDLEIMAGLAAELGKELYINNMEFESVCNSVGGTAETAAYCDIAAAGLTISDERKKTLDFSDSYYNAAQVLIVKEGDTTFADCKTAEDVMAKLKAMDSNTIIGVQTGTTGQFFCEGDESFGFEKLPVTCKGYTNGSLAVQNLLNGSVNFVIIDEGPAKSIVKAINAVN